MLLPDMENDYRGFERRQSHSPYTGAERRKQSGYPDTGDNVEQPQTEQDEHEQAQRQGPDPRIPK
jgi:hypothetical protein